MDAISILVVDDNEFIRASMMKFLETNKYSVVGAKNGQDAIEKLREQTFAMVVTDVLMPETDGFELIDFIRNDSEPTSSTPIIAISGGGRTVDASTALASLSAKVEVVLKKPFSKKDLLAKVAENIRKNDPNDVVLV